jgi:hypothetical protein
MAGRVPAEKNYSTVYSPWDFWIQILTIYIIPVREGFVNEKMSVGKSPEFGIFTEHD